MNSIYLSTLEEIERYRLVIKDSIVFSKANTKSNYGENRRSVLSSMYFMGCIPKAYYIKYVTDRRILSHKQYESICNWAIAKLNKLKEEYR